MAKLAIRWRRAVQVSVMGRALAKLPRQSSSDNPVQRHDLKATDMAPTTIFQLNFSKKANACIVDKSV